MQKELVADHSGLEPAYQLIYRGVAADADQAKIIGILGKLLHLNPEETRVALNEAPLQLVADPDRDKLRRLQLGLAKLGCISNIETALRYRKWFLSEALLDRFDQAARAGQAKALALLRFSPAPGPYRLKQLLSKIQQDGVYLLNESDLLIEREPLIHEGVGRWLKDLHKRAVAHTPSSEGRSIHGSFALLPEDGEQLEQVLMVLDERASHTPLNPVQGSVIRELPPRLLSGKPWNLLRQHGIESIQHPELPEEVRDELLQLWPIGEQDEEKPALSAGKVKDLLQAYSRQQQRRDDHRDTLLQQFTELDKLPSLPAIAMQVYQLAQSPDTSPEALADAVTKDPSLSARLLTVVNSPYFGLRARVDSIPHALVILGREELAHLALLLSSETVFRGLSSETGQALWRHSARTAEVARCLASHHPHFQPSSIYTAALLHDVGKIFLLSFALRPMQDIEQLCQRYELPSYELEREWFGHDHATLGATMLRRWGLPENLCRAVEQHHGPLPGQTEPLSTHAALVALADHVAQRLDDSAPWADASRLRRAQVQALKPYFGQLDLETIDLLAEDIRDEIRSGAPT